MRSLSKFTRPNVVVSQCLCGAPCRWDGERLNYDFVRALRRYANVIAVCPEMRIGLGVPRDRIILAKRENGVALYQPATRRRLAQKMNNFSRQYLTDMTDVDGFILKHKSPSCGVRGVKVYESTASDARFARTGTGLFASAVLAKCPHLAITGDERLQRDRTREHWLTQLFTLAAFRTVRKSHSFNRLRKFHTRHRILLRAHHQRHTRDLDRMLMPAANGPDDCATFEQYASVFDRILAASPRRASAIKPFEAALDYDARFLTSNEIRRFERHMESYLSGLSPLAKVRKTVQIWAVRYDKTFTRQDAAYRPYPSRLATA